MSEEITNSVRVRNKIGLVLPAFGKAGRRLWSHPDIRDIYPEYAFAVHSMIRASVPLMEAACDRAVQLPDDPIATGLADYLRQHIREEAHHDDWLLDDMQRLGFDRDALVARQPSTTVAAMVGAQYYWIHHYHPVALLGYIAVLEGYPPSVEMVDELVARTGYPSDVFYTLRKHAHLDPYHRDGLNDALDRLPLKPLHEALIGTSALFTVDSFLLVIDELLETHDRRAQVA